MPAERKSTFTPDGEKETPFKKCLGCGKDKRIKMFKGYKDTKKVGDTVINGYTRQTRCSDCETADPKQKTETKLKKMESDFMGEIESIKCAMRGLNNKLMGEISILEKELSNTKQLLQEQQEVESRTLPGGKNPLGSSQMPEWMLEGK